MISKSTSTMIHSYTFVNFHFINTFVTAKDTKIYNIIRTLTNVLECYTQTSYTVFTFFSFFLLFSL